MELLMNLYGGILSISLMDACFKPRYPGLLGRLLSLAAMGIYTGTVTILNHWMIFEGPASICYGLLLILYGAAARQGLLLDQVITAVLWDNVLMLTSLGVILSLVLTGDHPLIWAAGSPYRPAALAVTALFRAAAAVGIVKMKQRGWLRDRSLAAALALYFAFGLWGAAMVFEILNTGRWRESLPFYFLGLLAVTALLLLALRTAGKRRQERWEQEYFNAFCRRQEEQNRRILALDQSLSGLRHDMKGHLATAYLLLQSGQTDRAADYLEQLAGQLSKMGLEEEDHGDLAD